MTVAPVDRRVQSPGHLGVALLVAAPAWLVLDRRDAAAFGLLAMLAGVAPDAGLLLPLVHHHGVVHTFLAAVVAGVVLGPATAALVGRAPTRFRDRFAEGSPVRSRPRAFAGVAIAVGWASHVAADMLSAPDVAQPVEPFWPVVDGVVALDVVAVHAMTVNLGVLAAGLSVHAAALVATRE
ncbi:metal-dependent hydrolase [Halospeciosus flavus]|uniref:Metal-dependent hydrolase n=2 Tax=Halospeciosus flavus TaxID=3032283 RepID=A0ABD5Z8K3_9EURY|nr:metal-dependent hydrolase [Halospeciosus flavus]